MARAKVVWKRFSSYSKIEELKAKLSHYEQVLDSRMVFFLLKRAMATKANDTAASDEKLSELLALMTKLDLRLGERNDDDYDHQREALIASLAFDGMRSREDTLRQQRQTSGVKGTCEWVFSGFSAAKSFDAPFVNWLRSSDKVLWIQGKPGSGKSSLLHFIASDRQCLHGFISQNARPLCMSTFYFWKGAPTAVRSISSCLRSLLSQILLQNQVIDPSVYQTARPSHAGKLDSDWSLDELKTLFEAVLSTIPGDVFLVIDGLDESADGETEVVEFIYYLLRFTMIKLCMSSRPSPTFTSSFESFPGLQVQDYTKRSI